MWHVTQKKGDMVIVPPMVPHTVINEVRTFFDFSLKFSWNFLINFEGTIKLCSSCQYDAC